MANEEDSTSESDDNEMPEWARINRDRGILTKDDRMHLIDEKDLSEQAERNTRYRIRNRLRNSLYDFMFIDQELDNDDLKQATQTADNALNIMPVFSSITSVEREMRELKADVSLNISRSKPDLEQLYQRLVAGNATIDEFGYYMTVSGREETQELFKELRNLNKPLEVRAGGERGTIFDLSEIEEFLERNSDESTEEPTE
jgi:hypothetical protein